MHFKSKFLFTILTVFVFLFTNQSQLFAGFRLRDSIEEFGERRFVRHSIQQSAERRFLKPLPARLKAGPVIFHPTLETRVTYDDNILLEDQDAKEDIVFDIMPGAIIEVPIDTHQVVVGYEADIEVFTKRDTQNDQNQNMFALIDLSFPNWYINILDRFRETSGRAGTTFTGRIPRYDHSINPKIGYRWKRMVFEAAFNHTLRNFRRQVNDNLDYELVDWTGVVYFDLFANLKALVEYKVGEIDYDDDQFRVANFQQARVGFEGQIMPNLDVDLKVGAHFRDYEEPARNDFNSWIADLSLTYALREGLNLNAGFSREVVESTLATSNFYVEHAVGMGFSYNFVPRWTVYSDVVYYRHDYSERTVSPSRTGHRHDNHVKLETGLRYEFREWMDFKLAYEFRRRNSNFSASDHTNNRLSLTTSLFY